jgi:murein DD-endopeptidase MepM/ murein hydrolase activator NlpD
MRKIILNIVALSLFSALIAMGSMRLGDLIYYRNSAPFVLPIDKNDKNMIEIRCDSRGDGRFGASRSGGRGHNGVDIVAGIGTQVKAVRSGTAIARFDKNGYGIYVEVYHGKGMKTLYAHLSHCYIGYNMEKVYQGQIIGLVGKSGNAKHKGIMHHLHFEVIKEGQPVDPSLVFKDIKNCQMPNVAIKR